MREQPTGTEKIVVDPRVAMVEQQLLSQAIEAHLKNRNLVLAQKLFELENPPVMMKPEKASDAKGGKA